MNQGRVRRVALLCELVPSDRVIRSQFLAIHSHRLATLSSSEGFKVVADVLMVSIELIAYLHVQNINTDEDWVYLSL